MVRMVIVAMHPLELDIVLIGHHIWTENVVAHDAGRMHRAVRWRCQNGLGMIHVMAIGALLMNWHIFQVHVFVVLVVVVIVDDVVGGTSCDGRWNLLSVCHGRHAVMNRRDVLLNHRWGWCC